jgi:hypothetical protein
LSQFYLLILKLGTLPYVFNFSKLPYFSTNLVSVNTRQ